MLLRQATFLESLLRAGLGLLWLNLPLVLGAAISGRLLAGDRRGAARFCAQVAAGWAQILLSFELLGTAGVLSLGSLGLLQWAALGLWTGLQRRARLRSAQGGSAPPCTPGASGASGLQRQEEPAERDSRWAALVLLVLCLSLGPWLRQTGLPPVMEDTLTYHMSFPAEWLNSGELRMSVQHDADMGPTYYPFAAEALLGWWMLSFGTDSFATGSAGLCLPVMLAALAAIARDLGYGLRAATAAWALLGTAPLVVWLTLVGFNDLPLGCALLLALQGCLRLRRERSLGAAVEAGLGLGLVAAVKYSGPALGCGVALLGVAGALSGRGRASAAGRLAALCGTALLVGGYAYARNWMLTGSPLYPAHLEVLGHKLAAGLYSASDWVGHSHHRFDWRRHLLSAEGVSRIGWPLVALLPLLGMAGIGLEAWRKRLDGVLVGLCGPIGLAAFWAVSPYRHDPRFYVPGLALLAASAMPVLAAAARKLGGAFEPVLVLGLGGLFATSSYAQTHTAWWLVAMGLALGWRGGWRPPGRRAAGGLAGALALVTALRQPAYLEGRSRNWEPIYEGQRGKIWTALERLSPPQGLTVAASGTSNTYPLYGSDLRNRVVFVPRNGNTEAWVYGFGHPFRSVFESPEKGLWLENLRKLGVEMFVLGPARCEERAWVAAHPEIFELELQVGGFKLYRVRRGD